MTLKDYFSLENSLTRGELAQKCGVTRSFLGHIIAGRRNPSGPVAAKIVSVTDGKVAMRDLFPEEFALVKPPTPIEGRVNA